ncbi:hypothetical protein [Streptomyces sp. NPDC048606]|uniref:hypothetical protein n=1 Tax=Streptomyces sp. NPDC048606 TaxID=3154726 RepID=UPI0034273002
MVRIGHTMMTEQAGPRELVAHVLGAERAGFDEIALIQIGGDQQEPFLAWSETELLPALAEL